MKNKIVSLLAAGSILVGATQAFGLAVNVTVLDNAPGLNSFGSAPSFNVGNEDNETEPGTISSQVWDMEAFVVSGSTLYIVGGYNMSVGEAGSGGSVVGGMLTPGDLFIKVGGPNPGFAPTSNLPATVDNSVYGYTYAVDLSNPVGGLGSSATAYSLNSLSVFNTVVYDQFGANPWIYNSRATGSTTTSINYDPNNANNNLDLQAIGLGQLVGGNHNILAIDLSFLGSVTSGTTVYFSYTMECGNDSLKGEYSGGFDRVPDGSASLLLVGFGIASVMLFGIKRRRA